VLLLRNSDFRRARCSQLAEHRFRVVADAYETLRNPEARAKHDQDHFFRPSRS
jgi:curved DNA-binding protein CbpA